MNIVVPPSPSDIARDLKIAQKANDKQVKALSAPLRNMLVTGKVDTGKVRVKEGTRRSVADFTSRISKLAKDVKVALRKGFVDPNNPAHSVMASLDAMTLQFQDKDELQKMQAVFVAASAKDDSEAKNEAKLFLAEFVKTVVYCYITATGRWNDFFTIKNLARGDRPEITFDPNTKQKLRVRGIGIDGGQELVNPDNSGEITRWFPRLNRIATDMYEYPIYEPNRGDVRNDMMGLVDHAMDIASAIDQYLQSLIQVSSMPSNPFVASFVTTGDEENRDYLADSRVNTANFPTGNYIVLSSNTSTSKFRLEVLDEAIKYAGKWGQFSDGTTLSIEAIHVASSQAFDWLGTANAGSVSNMITDQVFSTGKVLDYAGSNFNMVSDNTIDPAAGIAYVRFNMPVGEVYRVPEADEIVVDDSKALYIANKERSCMISHFGTAMPLQWRKHVVAIKFKG
jgi:hypothetical protein